MLPTLPRVLLFFLSAAFRDVVVADPIETLLYTNSVLNTLNIHEANVKDTDFFRDLVDVKIFQDSDDGSDGAEAEGAHGKWHE